MENNVCLYLLCAAELRALNMKYAIIWKNRVYRFGAFFGNLYDISMLPCDFVYFVVHNLKPGHPNTPF